MQIACEFSSDQKLLSGFYGARRVEIRHHLNGLERVYLWKSYQGPRLTSGGDVTLRAVKPKVEITGDYGRDRFIFERHFAPGDSRRGMNARYLTWCSHRSMRAPW